MTSVTRSSQSPMGLPDCSWSITRIKDIADIDIRAKVVTLSAMYPWAPIKLCHRMLVACRGFDEACMSLRKYLITIPDEEDDIGGVTHKFVKYGSPVQTIIVGLN